MIIGLDFDNTIVCYDNLFYRVAVDRKLIPYSIGRSKVAVKKHLIECDQEEQWTELQGLVYGKRLIDAEAFPGALKAIECFHASGHRVHIISHKTKYPFIGEHYDLHAAALNWIDEKINFYKTLVETRDIHLCQTKAEKIHRIGEVKCDLFFDDLEEILLDPFFPNMVHKFLFDPGKMCALASRQLTVLSSWGNFVDVVKNMHSE